MKWINWGLNQTCNPLKMWYPKNLQELKDIVKEAREKKVNVRAVGSGHSWSNLVPTSGYLINTDNLNRLLSVDKAKKQVRIEGGMKLHQLNEILKDHGLALTNLGRVTKQSIAGATATGTHGTGHTPTLSSFIMGVELLTADGTLHVITADQNPDLLAAARLSLGSLGLIYALTLQCEDNFVLENQCEVKEFDAIFRDHDRLLKAHDYWMFEWNPYTGKALTYAWDRTRSSHSRSVLRKYVNAFHEATFDLLSILIKPFPQFNPALIDLRYRFTAHASFCADSVAVLTRPYVGMRYVECEMSIRPSYLPQAVEMLKKLFAKYQQKEIYVPRVTFRFVAHEKGTLLSPTYDGDRVFISLVMPAHSAFNEVFPDYQSRMEAFEARPHWGKIHQIDQEMAHKLYGDNLTQFLNIRERLDPLGMFLNEQINALY